MKKILIFVGAAGVVVAIAIGARKQLSPDYEAVAPTETLAISGVQTHPVPAPPLDARDSTDDVGSPSGPEAKPAPDRAPPPAAAIPPAPPAAPPRAAPVPADDATTDSPETDAILRRASAAYDKVRSLRATFTQQLDNPLLGMNISSAGTLYQLRPDRIALKFSKPEGDLLMSDGRYFWIFYPSVDAKQVIRAPASAAGQGGVDLQAQFLGDPVKRFSSTLNGKESVAGRSAFVLTMIPRTPMGYKQLKVWIDEKDALARRFEIAEENGNVRRFELRDVQVNAAIPEDVFRFVPPAGARVIDRG